MVQHNPWVTEVPAPPAPPTSPAARVARVVRPGERDSDTGELQTEEEVEPVPVTGPTRPQVGVPAPENGLPVRAHAGSASLFIVGAHGGAGESMVAALDPRWCATDHSWPELPAAEPAQCVLVARTHAAGLMAAQRALTQWAASASGASAQCVGLVLIADAPGKLPAPILDLIKVVSGGAPRVWRLGWIEEWRLGDLDSPPPKPARRLLRQLHKLPSAPAGRNNPIEGE